MHLATSTRVTLAAGLAAIAITVAPLAGVRPSATDSAANGDWRAMLAASVAEAAAVDYFLRIDGIEGESTDETHKNAIDVESWSWGASQTASRGGGGGAGKVSMQDFSFTMSTNKASPKLFLAAATGEHIKEAVLTVRKSGGDQQEFIVVKFKDLLVSSYQTGGSSGDVVPTDQVSLNFGSVEFNFTPSSERGTGLPPVTACWSLVQNKAC